MKIPHYGEVTFRVRTGLYDFQLRLHRVHRHLSLFRKFPTDSGYWSLEGFSRLDFEDAPFRAVIRIEGTHRSSEAAPGKLEDVLDRLRGYQDDYPALSVIRFEIRPEVDYPDWFHAQPGADTPWLGGTAECGAYHLRGYFEELLAALEECYPGAIEFDMPSASPEGQIATPANGNVGEPLPVSSGKLLAEVETSCPETRGQGTLSTDLQVETQAARLSSSIDDESWLTVASGDVEEPSPVSFIELLAEIETSYSETGEQGVLSADIEIETQPETLDEGGEEEPPLSIDDEPWLMIPDTGYDRRMLRLWWEGYTGPEIGVRVGKTPKTIYNRLWVLRGRHGTAIVLTDDKRRELRLK